MSTLYLMEFQCDFVQRFTLLATQNLARTLITWRSIIVRRVSWIKVLQNEAKFFYFTFTSHRLFSSNSDIVHKKRSFEIDLIKSYVKSQPSDCKTLSWWSIWRNWICAHWIGGNMMGRRQKWASIGSWSHCSWRIGTLASSHDN